MTSPKVTLLLGFLLPSFALSESKLGSQAVPTICPSWPSWFCWIKLPKLNPIVIICWPKFAKLRFASWWSKLPKLDSPPRIGLKLPKLTSSRSGSDSGLSLSRSKLFKLDSRLFFVVVVVVVVVVVIVVGMVVVVGGDVVVVVVVVVVIACVVVVCCCCCCCSCCRRCASHSLLQALPPSCALLGADLQSHLEAEASCA